MAKQLIGAHNVDAHIFAETGTIHIDRDMILSPGAQDILRNRGIRISYEACPAEAPIRPQASGDTAREGNAGPCIRGDNKDCPAVTDCEATGTGFLCQTLARAEEILLKKYGITDRRRREAVLLNITAQLKTSTGEKKP